MAWISASMADVLGDSTAKAQAAISDAQKAVSGLNAQVNALAGQYVDALDAVTNNKSMLDKMMASGFYMIPLSPKLGAWDTRLATAPNEPPTFGYCTGTATIIIAPDPATLLKSFNTMKAALMKPFDSAVDFLGALDFSDFEIELPDLPEIPALTAPDWDSLFAVDEWSGATLGDVFGGAAEGLSKATAELGAEGLSALSIKNQMNQSLSGLNKGLSQAKAFMSDLAAAGVYNLILEPGAGDYLARLRSEPGAPPSDPDMYSAGFVCITLAGGIGDLQAKFDTLQKIRSGN